MMGDRERIVCSRHVQRAVRLITLNSQITRVIRASAPRRLIKLRSIIAVQPSSWSPAGLLGRGSRYKARSDFLSPTNDALM